ncbi:MAG TPA: hypothetical protein VJH37_05410, partial [Candidatus Nanoarchaeia archaeon]|nr:hypothetical protein [Candidatus Nanoarchaeia archaeon]
MMFLVVLLPIEQAYAADPVSSSGEQIIDRTRNIPNDLVRQGEAIRDEVLDDLQGIQDSPEDIIGEDIIVQVDDYQPRIIRSSLLEDSGIFVHALISGTPTNPTITVPRIRDIVIRSQKITTIPQGLPVSVGRITHVDPPNNALSYDNLGTLVIPIRQIPQEGKVPDEIIVDVDARIFFDVSEGLFFGPVQDILTEQSLEEWKLTREDHSFYAGYIHATEIKEDQASFMIYDNQLNELTTTPVKLTVGQTSRSLSANRGGFVTYGRLFDRYTLKLNNIKSISDKVRLLINRNGNVQSAYLTEGDDLYQGSQWYVENIAGDVKGVSLAVTLRNKVNRQSLTLEGKQVELPQLPSEPSEPLSSSSSQPGESNEQKKKRTQFEEILKKFYAIYNKKDENVNDVKKYDDLAREIDKDILQDTNTPAQVKEQALNVVKTIRNYYVQKQTELQAALNLNHTQESENKLLIVTGFIKTIEEILKKYTQTREPSSLQGSNDPSVLYRLAIEEYEKVIQNYPNIKEYSAKAHWKIANLALLPGVKDRQGAVNHLEILLRNYQEKDYINYMKKTEIEKLLALIRSADVDLESITKEITEGQDVNYVTLLGAVSVPDNLKSKATIEVEGFPSKEYREGEQLLQDDKDELKWFVKEIRNTEVVLQEERTRQIESIYRDSQNKNQQRQLSTGTNKKRTVRLTKTDTKKEASITISPNTEAAFSEAIFSLHLPIEKRALDLPLFSDTIDEEIAKTEDLIAKLDKIVENVGKVTEYWKKFCFITFAVVWVKNFFSGIFGGSGALARERTNNAFEKKYDEYRNLGTDDTKNCRGLSYDECVFKNQAEYDRMVTQSGSAISAVNQGSYQQSFKTLGSEYTNSKKDLAYYENLAKQDPTNQAYRDKYYEIHARLTRAEEEQQFSKQFFVDGRPKSYDEVGAATADPIVDRYQPEIVQKFTVPPGRKNDKAFLWRTYNTRFLPLEREKQINDEMKKYLDGVQSSGTSLGTATEKDNDYLEKLKESYGVTQATQLGEF